MGIKKRLLMLMALITIFIVGCTEENTLQETDWVRDETGELTQETLDSVTSLNEEILESYETKPQVAIEVLKKLPKGYSDIDEYRNKRFKELGIGDKEKDSGLLYILALDDREFAIEVGYGVEHIITDIESKHILDGTIKDLEKYSEYGNAKYLNGVVNQVVGEISNVFEKENNGELDIYRQSVKDRQEEEDKNYKIFVILVIVLLVGYFIISIVADDGGYSGGGYSGGSSFGSSSRRSGGSSFGSGFGGGRSGGGGASGGW